MKIPFGDLKRSYLADKENYQKAVMDILESGWYILGKQTEEFEKEFAAYCKSSFGVGVNSGTDALRISLDALGVKPGNEVITVPNSAVPTAVSISLTGAVPRFVDIKEDTSTIDPEKLERAINNKTKAIMPVHLYGQAADMDEILEIANRHRIPVIEDACQAHGARDKNRYVGSIGRLGCFSFYPSKNLGAFGDAGMVVTDDKNLYEKLIKLRNYGQEDRYNSVESGMNTRLDEIQSALLRVKLRSLDKMTKRRKEIAGFYNENIKNELIINPNCVDYNRHVFHLYVVRVKDNRRDEFREYLSDHGIGAQIHYPIPIHLQGAYAFLNHKEGDFPVTERLSGEILSLPIYPELTKVEIDHVLQTINNFC